MCSKAGPFSFVVAPSNALGTGSWDSISAVSASSRLGAWDTVAPRTGVADCPWREAWEASKVQAMGYTGLR